VSITDWLGNETVKILAFEEARELVRKEELGKFKRQWEEWSRDHRPSNVPSSPDKKYADKR